MGVNLIKNIEILVISITYSISRKFGNVASSIFAASVESFKKKSYYK